MRKINKAAGRRGGLASWWAAAAGTGSTAKSRAATSANVSDRAAWEMEKATLLRDLTERERGLVNTFSDRANFRAAVAALVKVPFFCVCVKRWRWYRIGVRRACSCCCRAGPP